MITKQKFTVVKYCKRVVICCYGLQVWCPHST